MGWGILGIRGRDLTLEVGLGIWGALEGLGFDFLIFFFAGAESWLEDVEVLGMVPGGGAGEEEDFGEEALGGGEDFLDFFFFLFFFFGILRVSLCLP